MELNADLGISESTRDINMVLSTMSGRSTFRQKVKGTLKAFIISSTDKVHVKISSSLGYIIFENKEYIGNNYIVPTAQCFDEEGHLRTQQSFLYELNEDLIFEVDGQPNKDINIIIRS